MGARDAWKTIPSKTHDARKALFKKGLTERFVTMNEIEAAVPLSDDLSERERGMLVVSLQLAGIEIRSSK